MGPNALGLTAARGARTYEMESQHFDLASGATKLWYVPLRPQTTLESQMLDLNDPSHWGLPTLPIPDPGDFNITASFVSEGSDAVNETSPVWRGRTQSKPVSVRFTSPPDRCGNGELNWRVAGTGTAWTLLSPSSWRVVYAVAG